MFDIGSMANWGGIPKPASVLSGVQDPLYSLSSLTGLNDFQAPGFLPTGGVGGPATGVGGAAATAAGLAGQKLGLNMGTANLALTGLQSLGSLYAAFQAQKLAKKQFAFTKDITETNLANQLKTYNTQLTDRANNRAIVEGRTPDQTKAYIDANSLARYGK